MAMRSVQASASARRASKGQQGGPAGANAWSDVSSSDSQSDSDWDRYSWRHDELDVSAPALSRHTVGSLASASSLGSFSVRLQQDSLFDLSGGVSPSRQLVHFRDTGRLRTAKLGGCTLVNQYLIVKYLGRGSCGRVFLAMSIEDHRLYAVKARPVHIVHKVQMEAGKAVRSGSRKRNPLEDLQQEIAIMREMAHPNIVTLREVTITCCDVFSSSMMSCSAAVISLDIVALREALGGRDSPHAAGALAPGAQREAGLRPRLFETTQTPHTRAHRSADVSVQVVDDTASNKMLLVMDYLEGGPVLSRAALDAGQRIPEDVARLYFRDMVKAVDYLHARRVVHGDLKPENALMGAAARVALSDFGCSKVGVRGGGCGVAVDACVLARHKVMTWEDEEFDRCNGTPAFLAPEMMRPHARYRGRPADVYALGACLYTFVCGRIPFTAANVMQLFETVLSTPVSFPELEPPLSPALQGMLLGMLAKDPTERLTVGEVMAHPWTTLDGAFPLASASCPRRKQRSPRPLPPEAQDAAAGAAQSRQERQEQPAPQQHVEAASAPAPTQRGEEGRVGESEEASPRPEEGQEEQEEEEEGAAAAQQEEEGDPLLGRDMVAGLITPDLPVLSFATREALMRQDDKGWDMLYILEGECEVHYRPTLHDTEAAAAAGIPSPSPSVASLVGHSPGRRPRSSPAPRSPPPALSPRPSSASAGALAQLVRHGSSGRQLAPSRSPGGAGAWGGAASRHGSLTEQSPGGLRLTSSEQMGAELCLSMESTACSTGTANTPPVTSRRDSGAIASAAAAAAAAAAAVAASRLAQQQQESQSQQQKESLQAVAPRGGADRRLPNGPPSPGSPSASGIGSHPLPPSPQPPELPGARLDREGAMEGALRVRSRGRLVSHVLQGPAGGDALADTASSALPGGARPPPLPPKVPSPATAQPLQGQEQEGAQGGFSFPPAAPHGRRPQLSVQVPQEDQPETPCLGAAPTGSLGSQAFAAAAQGVGPEAGTPTKQPSPATGEELPPTLAEAVAEAQEVVAQLRRSATEYLVARRCPGDVVGEMEALKGPGSQRLASVVAASPTVRAAVLPYSLARAYLVQQPLAKQQLAELAWLRHSETIVLEALTRLASLGGELERLQSAAAPVAASPAASASIALRR
eukprot:scaffold7.g3545.t1